MNIEEIAEEKLKDMHTFAKAVTDYDRVCQAYLDLLANKEGEWVSVKARLPKHETVLVHCPYGSYGKVYSASFGEEVFHTGDDIVTHWMKLPEPPERE